MKISLSWIKEFVDLDSTISPADVMRKLTLATCEVEGLEIKGEGLKGVTVVKVLSRTKHPEADKLGLVTFQTAQGTREVVCGAQNVREGMYTAYAPVGLTLPNGMKLEAKKIRGVMSEGMLCSETELCLSHESAGIMDLTQANDGDIGKEIATFLNLKNDIILEIDNKSLTHRPDLWGHYGMAQEFAAIFNKKLKNPYASLALKKSTGGPTPITVEFSGESAGLSYMGISLKGVQVNNQTPRWIKDRLESVGLRSINNLVDISNYVMLELGIPNHIFDRAKIQGTKLVISTLKEDRKFTTLDDIERELKVGDTVIGDESGPLVIAGIMGGKSSSVSETTKEIFIEVANWKYAAVRKTSSRLGLRTDSSQRYEKSLDSTLIERTLKRMVQLINDVCPQMEIVGEKVYAGVDLNKIHGRKIELNLDVVSKFLGKDLEDQEIITILQSLDFKLEKALSNPRILMVQVPTYRDTKDIEGAHDLMEEIGRIVGFDNIQAKMPKMLIKPARLDKAQVMRRKIQDFMVLNAEAMEITTYPLVGHELLQKCAWHELGSLKMQNPLSVEHDQMRPNLIPSLVECLYNNQKHQENFRLFELGRSYRPGKNEFCLEQNFLSVAFFDRDQNQFAALVDLIERLSKFLKIEMVLDRSFQFIGDDLLSEQGKWAGVHPLEKIGIKVRGKTHGVIFSLHPKMLKNWKIKGQAHICLLRLSELETWDLSDKRSFKEISKFPGSSFDCTVVVDKATFVEDILKVFKKVKDGKYLGTKVVGVFQLSETQKTVTLRSEFLDKELTLTADYLDRARKEIVQLLEEGKFPLKN